MIDHREWGGYEFVFLSHLKAILSIPSTRKLKGGDSQVQKQLPEDGKHDSLAPIRNNSRLQSTTEQSQESIRSHDVSGSGKVSNVAFVNLAVRLDDAQGV